MTKKNNIEAFLTAEEETAIIEAIRTAEKNTSGEIRVHIEKNFKTEAFERATEIFYELKMDNTKDRNGVLIYIAVQDKTFVIYGDQGINDRVGKAFWDTTRDIMQAHFKKGDFKTGLVNGILKAGEELKRYFPWKNNDTNELPNTISK